MLAFDCMKALGSFSNGESFLLAVIDSCGCEIISNCLDDDAINLRSAGSFSFDSIQFAIRKFHEVRLGRTMLGLRRFTFLIIAVHEKLCKTRGERNVYGRFFHFQLDFARVRNGCQEHNKTIFSFCLCVSCEYQIFVLCSFVAAIK